MEFVKTDDKLIIKVVSDGAKACLNGYPEDEIDTDKAMYDFFDDILCNTEWEWIEAEEIGCLTSAPILGIKDENDNVIEAYGFMDYAVRSLLGDLLEYGEAILQKG